MVLERFLMVLETQKSKFKYVGLMPEVHQITYTANHTFSKDAMIKPIKVCPILSEVEANKSKYFVFDK